MQDTQGKGVTADIPGDEDLNLQYSDHEGNLHKYDTNGRVSIEKISENN